MTERERTDAEPAVRVSDLTRTFGDVRALDHADLVAGRGEVTALVGANGSGKTTLLLVLAGLLAPDSGTVRVAGVDPVTDPADLRGVVGWMPDAFGTWESLTCREVLHTLGAAHRMPAADVRRRTDEVLRLVRLDELASRPARVLSRGQRQRLGLAQALLHSPQVLLLDEPASGLDPRSRIELRDVLRALAARGTSVLISSHVLAELEEMADRALVMDGGRVVASQDLRDVTATTTWRVAVLDVPRLRTLLERRGVPFADVPTAHIVQGPSGAGEATFSGDVPGISRERGAVDVEVADEREAVALLRALVLENVPVIGFGPPPGGRLETAYLAATGEETP